MNAPGNPDNSCDRHTPSSGTVPLLSETGVGNSVFPQAIYGASPSHRAPSLAQGIQALSTRVRAEYQEMPGLCLTLPQACRLWQIDVRVSASILDALVAEGFLRRTSEGAFRAAKD